MEAPKLNGFIYKNQSTETIIGRRLILCSYDSAVDSVVGVERESQIGGVTITRPIANDYGVINTTLKFTYGLMLDPCETDTVPYITHDEQIIIERWLTSSKFASDLYIINDNQDVIATYCGKFIQTEWKPDMSFLGFSGVVFTFENNSAYPKEHYAENFKGTQNDWTFTIYNDSDETEEYIYPTLVINNPDATQNVTITNMSDTGEINEVTIKAESNVDILMDCQHCILTNGRNNTAYNFDEIGWSDVGNIYWPRLLPGENVFKVSVPCSVDVVYDVVRKKVGGWLDD